MIQTSQNLDFFNEKPLTMLTIFDKSLAPFWKRLLLVKQ